MIRGLCRYCGASSADNALLPGFESSPLRRQRRRKPGDISWVKPLLEDVRAVSGIEIRRMTPEQRFLLARGFALKIGGCTKDERLNIKHGLEVAKELADIAFSEFGSWQGVQWLGACYDARILAGDIPILNPWCFKAMLKPTCEIATAKTSR